MREAGAPSSLSRGTPRRQRPLRRTASSALAAGTGRPGCPVAGCGSPDCRQARTAPAPGGDGGRDGTGRTPPLPPPAASFRLRARRLTYFLSAALAARHFRRRRFLSGCGALVSRPGLPPPLSRPAASSPVPSALQVPAAAMAMRQTPLTCSGHTRPVVDLAFSGVTPYGYFLISACKGERGRAAAATGPVSPAPLFPPARPEGGGVGRGAAVVAGASGSGPGGRRWPRRLCQGALLARRNAGACRVASAYGAAERKRQRTAGC